MTVSEFQKERFKQLSQELADLLAANQSDRNPALADAIEVAGEIEMPIVQPTTGGYEGPEIPDGQYTLSCKNVTAIKPEKPDKFGKMTTKLRIELQGVTEDGEVFTIDPLINLAWSNIPGKTPSTLFTYAEAFGCNPDANIPFDTDALIGKKAAAFIHTDEEPGAWPRIQTLNKIKARASTPAAAPVVEQPTGTVLKADGTLDTNAFWTQCRLLKLTRDQVIAEWNGDVENILKADPIEVAEWVQIKLEQAGIPFDN